jgi:quinolinate synthase
VPDRNLALYVAQKLPEKNIIPWDGFCYVHQRFTEDEVRLAKECNPKAEVIAHPECTPEVLRLSDYICSTTSMLSYANQSKTQTFIILTEIGMVERLKQENPNKTFLTPMKTCIQMKRNSLEAVRDALLLKQHRVTVPEDIRKKAKLSLERMLRVS